MIEAAARLALAQITNAVNKAQSLGSDKDIRQKNRFVMIRAGYSNSLPSVNEALYLREHDFVRAYANIAA